MEFAINTSDIASRLDKTNVSVNGKPVAHDLFVEHAGVWIVQPELVHEHAYVVQRFAFKDDVRKLCTALSLQVTTKVQESKFHYHTETHELYWFLAGEWTLETLPLFDAIEGRPPTITHVITHAPRLLWVPPGTCHRLNGDGLGLVLKAPPSPGVGTEAGKTPCTLCAYASKCRLRQKLVVPEE